MRADPLAIQYPVRIRLVTVLVLCGLTLSFFSVPRFLGEAQKMPTIISEPDIEVFDIPIIDFRTPEPPKRPPAVPAAVDDEFLDDGDATIEDTDFTEYTTYSDPPPKPKSGPKYCPIRYEVKPKNIIGIKPVYPEWEHEIGIEGTVIVAFFIDVNGDVKNEYIYQNPTNTGLDAAALEAVRKSKWKPAINQDKKVGVWVAVPIKFELN